MRSLEIYDLVKITIHPEHIYKNTHGNQSYSHETIGVYKSRENALDALIKDSARHGVTEAETMLFADGASESFSINESKTGYTYIWILRKIEKTHSSFRI